MGEVEGLMLLLVERVRNEETIEELVALDLARIIVLRS
jgi:hypothetical protein